jgi:rRNA-processing protein FCF1
MSEHAVAVVDTNVLLNLATPVVDGRETAPSGADPLKTLLSVYDVHIPSSVLGEISDVTGGNDLLSTAADLVLKSAHHLETYDLDNQTEERFDYGLDRGESDCIWLANELETALFITDEFNTTNYLFINLALDDRNILFTTPHILCTLAAHDILSREYVDTALTYYLETKNWDPQYVSQLRKQYLSN